MMRRIVAIVIALLAATASAGVQKPAKVIAVNPGKVIPDEGAQTLLLHAPFNASDGSFLSDVNTVANVSWNGTALVDSKGNSWTQNGTVPQLTTSPFYPNGFSGSAKPGAGPFSDANYYSLGTGSDVLDFAGDFSACVAWIATSVLTTRALATDGAFNADGWAVTDDQTVFINQSGANQSVVLGAPTLNGPAVTCFGQLSTGKAVGKQNLGTYLQSAGTVTITPGTTRIAQLGRYTVGGANRNLAGNMYAAWFSSTTPSDALFTSIQSRLFGHVIATGQTLTVSRATTASAAPVASASPSLYYWPANILRITENGVLIESAITNLVLQSSAIDNASWTTSGVCTTTADQAVFVDGQTTMDKVQCTGIADSRFQGVGFASTTGPFTVSAWVAATTGTAIESVGFNLAGGTGCTCARSDGGACNVASATPNFAAYATVGTTPVRLALTCSAGAAVIAASPFVHDGQFNTTGNVGGYFGGVQFEVANAFASSYIPTTTVTVARSADVVTVANPLPVGPYCVTGTWTPALAPLSSWNIGVARDLWFFGTAGAANSARLQIPTDGRIILQVVDGAATSKTWTVAAGAITGTAAATITACSDNGGNATVTLNGAAQSVTAAGAGTGVLSSMGTVGLAQTAAQPTVAAVKNFKVCKTSNPAKC